MSKRSPNPSKERMARALLPLAKPILTGQHWLLLPAAVQGFLGIADDAGRKKWLRTLAAALPVEMGAAIPGVSPIPEETLSQVERWAAILVELVRREVTGLRIAGFEDGILASEVLARDVEALAGELARALNEVGEAITPEVLVGILTERFGPRLKPILGTFAPAVAQHLAKAIVVAMRSSPALQASFITAHENQTERIADDLLRVLERLGALQGLLAELRTTVLKVSGEPTDEDVAAVVETTRAWARSAAAEAFAEQLCRPYGLTGARDRASDRGEVVRFDVKVPRWFDHVPHTLERWNPDGESGVSDAPRVRWEPFDAEALLDMIGQGRRRVLVLGRAGFGKTTFMYWLACRLAAGDTGTVPLGPVRAGKENLTQGNVSAAVAAWVRSFTRFGEFSDKETYRRSVAVAALRRGHSVLLVDGLDQIRDTASAARALVNSEDVGCLVASCREEVGLPVEHGWDLVVRLRHPAEDTFRERVVEDVREFLDKSAGRVLARGGAYVATDLRHPFLLHVARVVALPDGDPRDTTKEFTDPGLTGLLDGYVRRITDHGREHAGRDGHQRIGDRLDRDEREALGTLGLLSVTLTGANSSSATMQDLDETVLDEVVRAVEDRTGRDFHVREFFDLTATHTALVYVVEHAFARGTPTYTFHHQLVQEYLAALGIALRVGETKDPLTELVKLVADVVSPRSVGAPERGEPIRDRVLGLHIWSMLGELLALKFRNLAEGLVLDVSKWLFEESNNVVENGSFHPLELSPLVAVRDAIVEALARKNVLANRQLSHPKDSVVAQFAEANVPPDPFMVLCWEEERRLIREQVASVADWLLDQSVKEKEIDKEIFGRLQDACETGDVKARIDALKPVLKGLLESQGKQGVEWKVESYGPTLAAFRPGAREPSWLLVPHGPLVAGDVEAARELPVRVGTVEGPFWVGFDPVTVGEFKDFIDGGGYANDLAGAWWQAFDRKALQEAVGDRRKPWEWKGQQGQEERPVVGVSWFEAMAYCLWRSQEHGEPLRLPGEAEWEKASRGLLGRRWPWGCSWRPELAVHDLEWDLRNLAPARKNRNLSPFGVRGMAGNVWEWTRTRWQDEQFGEEVGMEKAEAFEPISVRGGSFNDVRLELRCACRGGFRAGYRFGNFGFRCFRDVI
ncbi:MAG: SUMF1/EgtB/PvdO family nonheme iron enzyme [Acidobacteria bacterium]|nr:SUMF1/EgtB/PvdO family nonheme iron enzyme [Acidobacteriota bacterium]